MGFFRFRRTVKIVPGVRLNLSGSGASVSLGPRGLHFTIGPHGTRTTVGLPGSGISWTSYQSYGSSPSPPNRQVRYTGDTDAYEPTSSDGNATVIDSAPIEQLVANSTIDVAKALNASRARWNSYKILLAVLSALFVAASVMAMASGAALPPAVVFSAVIGAAIIIGSIALHGRRSSTVSLDYGLSTEESERFDALTRAFGALAGCSRIWRIPQEKEQKDWKRNAGASKTVEREQVSLTRGNPPLIKSNIEFLQLPLGKEILYFTPDAILVVAGDRVAALPYNDVEIVCRQTRFIEDDAAPSDAKVVGETWRYINRNGGPDRRFANNRKLPICLYGEIDFKSASGLNERIHCSRVDVSEEFASTTAAIRTTDVPTASNLLNSTSVERPEPYMNSLNPGYSVPLGASSADGGSPLPIVLCVTCRSKDISSKKRLWQSNAITFVCNDCGTALEQVGDQYKLTHVTDTESPIWQKYAGKILYRREWANIAQGGYSDEELAIRWGSAGRKREESPQ